METKERDSSDNRDLGEDQQVVGEESKALELPSEYEDDRRQLTVKATLDKTIMLQNLAKRIGAVKADVDNILNHRLRNGMTVDVTRCMDILLDSSNPLIRQNRMWEINGILNQLETRVIEYKKKERLVDVYIWIIHGNTTTHTNVLVETPVDNIFQDVVAYANNATTITNRDYDEIERNPEGFLKGVMRNGARLGNRCHRGSMTPASIRDKVSLYFVPATFFSINPPHLEKAGLKPYLGLRRVRLRISNDDPNEEIYTLEETEMLINYTDLLNIIQPGQRYTIQTIRFCIEAAVLKNYGK